MKRLLWMVMLVVAAGAAWAQFYEHLGPAERRELAEAYYLVGRQYALQGERAKALEFEGLAYHLDPELDPAAISPEPGSKEAVGTAGPGPGAAGLEPGSARREAPEAVAVLLKSRFLRLVSAFLTEDAPTLVELMDGSLWFTRFSVELTQEAIAGDLRSFFARVNLSGGLAPSAVYELDSLEVSPVQGAPAAWGPCYAVRITARADFSEEVAFWERQQQYLFHPRDGQWLLFAVGQGLPPASWNPQAPQAPAAATVESGNQLKSIREAFLSSLRLFLARQPSEASRYFTREILIVRLNATLTRDEMAATFEGYFEGSDFEGVSAEQVLDPGSISVEPSERFADRRPGPEYRLSVRTRLDLSDRIPFWTRFQEYYFSREEGDWRIFAIF
jgi:hypothetical protein